MIPMLDLAAQHANLADEIEAALARVVASGRYVLGANVQAFEKEAAQWLGIEHAVTCASGTDALHLSLLGLGIGPGDEVITTPFSFAATAEAIRYVGARPVFVDIDPHTFNLDPARAAAAVTPATRALLPVHLFGQPAELAPLLDVAQHHGLALIEDCAQAFGAHYDGRPVGTFGAAGCFSFFPTKNLGACGDGGMVVTRDERLAARLRTLRNHGAAERDRHEIVGYNSRLDELQAAILRLKLRYVSEYNAARRRIAAQYEAGLADVPGLVTPAAGPRGIHVYHQYTLCVPRRAAVREALRAAGVDSAVYYPTPLHRQPAFARDHDGRDLPNAEAVAERCLSLPIYPELEGHRIARVIAAVREAATANAYPVYDRDSDDPINDASEL